MSKQAKKIRFKENLEGRVANLAMSPIKKNSLIPLFEAVTNAIDSIKEKYGKKFSEGKIDIFVERGEDDRPLAFTITDNGIGLNEKNFDSFCTYDSRYKVERGGKGVGRLVWLKSFEEVHVKSIYKDKGDTKKREFSFVLDNNDPFRGYEDAEIDLDMHETKVSLINMKDKYRQVCPKGLDKISHKLLSHFLQIVLDKSCPEIKLRCKDKKGEEEVIIINNFVEEAIYEKKVDKFSVENLGNFEIIHMRLNKSIIEEKGHHALSYLANGRIVKSDEMKNKLGLSRAIEHEGEKCFYRGTISGNFLDKCVTQERNNFDASEIEIEKIERKALSLVKKYLAKEIEKINEQKFKVAKDILMGFPKYRYLAKDDVSLRKFISSLPQNVIKPEAIYTYFSVRDYRKNEKLRKKIASDFKEKVGTQQEKMEFAEDLKQMVDDIDEQQTYALAEYVAKRKLTIELLSKFMGRNVSGKNYYENAVHELICPLRETSDSKIDCESHNLWLIDDRLAYYDYWASDKTIGTFIKESDSTEEPDIILFDRNALFGQKNTGSPAVIIEFKRPGEVVRYGKRENPFSQIYNYAEAIRGHIVHNAKGDRVTKLEEDDLVHCYFICDIDEHMEDKIKDHLPTSGKLPKNRGYHAYNDKRNIYFQILSYDYLIEDARLRNEAFFKKLDIS